MPLMASGPHSRSSDSRLQANKSTYVLCTVLLDQFRNGVSAIQQGERSSELVLKHLIRGYALLPVNCGQHIVEVNGAIKWMFAVW